MTEDQADIKLREYGLLFSELMKSGRFRELLGFYFTFIRAVNDETKEIDIQVIENPPERVAELMQAAAGTQKQQEPQVQLVSGSAAQAVLAQAKKAAAEVGGRRYKDPKRR